MTGNPKADALKLTLENLPKDDSYDDVRAVLVDMYMDSVLEATRMKPLGARLDDYEAAVGRAAKRRQEEDIIKIAEVVRRNAEDEENKLKAELLQLQSSAAEKSGGSEDSIAQMNASLARVLSEMKESQFVEAHAVAEAEKLMGSLSVALSRVAQLARHAAESQMKIEISLRTPKGTARGGRDADWTPAQQPDKRGPRITGKTSVDELETPVQGVSRRDRGARQHDVCQLGSKPSQNRTWKSKFEAAC